MSLSLRGWMLLGLSTSALSGFGCAHHHGCPKHHGPTGVESGILVSGSGEAKSAPNLARANVGIEVRALDVEQATAQANAQMERLISVIKAQGIAPQDMRTHGFSVSFDRDYQAPPAPLAESLPAAAPKAARKGAAASTELAAPAPAPTPPSQRGSYVVTNMVEITVRNLDNVGKVLTAATTAGANNIWGISFDIEDKRPLVEKARAEAFEHARQDAERLAELSGVALGPIVQISEGNAAPFASPQSFGMMRDSAVANVPVERGELTVSHQVSVRFAITPGHAHGHQHPHEHDGKKHEHDHAHKGDHAHQHGGENPPPAARTLAPPPPAPPAPAAAPKPAAPAPQAAAPAPQAAPVPAPKPAAPAPQTAAPAPKPAAPAPQTATPAPASAPSAPAAPARSTTVTATPVAPAPAPRP